MDLGNLAKITLFYLLIHQKLTTKIGVLKVLKEIGIVVNVLIHKRNGQCSGGSTLALWVIIASFWELA